LSFGLDLRFGAFSLYRFITTFKPAFSIFFSIFAFTFIDYIVPLTSRLV